MTTLSTTSRPQVGARIAMAMNLILVNFLCVETLKLNSRALQLRDSFERMTPPKLDD